MTLIAHYVYLLYVACQQDQRLYRWGSSLVNSPTGSPQVGWFYQVLLHKCYNFGKNWLGQNNKDKLTGKQLQSKASFSFDKTSMNMISSMWGLPRSFFPAWPTTSDLLLRKVFGVECRQIQVIHTSPSLFLLSKRSFSYQEVVLQKLGLPQKYGLVWQG